MTTDQARITITEEIKRQSAKHGVPQSQILDRHGEYRSGRPRVARVETVARLRAAGIPSAVIASGFAIHDNTVVKWVQQQREIDARTPAPVIPAAPCP